MVRIFFILILFLFSCSSSLIKDESSSIKIDNAIKFIEEKKYSRAIDELEYILLTDPLSDYANDAQFYLAESYYNLENYNQAIIEFEKYLSRRSIVSDLIVKSQLLLCKCYYNVSLDYNKDQSATYIAIEKLQYFIEKDSMSNYISEIEQMILGLRNKLAKKDFYTAKLYVRLDELDSAIIYFKSVIDEYYDTMYYYDALINAAILYCVDDVNESILFLESYKNSFISIKDYNESIQFINNLELDKDKDYYINQLR